MEACARTDPQKFANIVQRDTCKVWSMQIVVFAQPSFRSAMVHHQRLKAADAVARTAKLAAGWLECSETHADCDNKSDMKLQLCTIQRQLLWTACDAEPVNVQKPAEATAEHHQWSCKGRATSLICSAASRSEECLPLLDRWWCYVAPVRKCSIEEPQIMAHAHRIHDCEFA